MEYSFVISSNTFKKSGFGLIAAQWTGVINIGPFDFFKADGLFIYPKSFGLGKFKTFEWTLLYP